MATAREVLDELADKAGWTYEEMLVVACAYIDVQRSPLAFQEFAEKQYKAATQTPDEDDTLVDIAPPKVST